jgi:tRNA A-37 threonylcarbamoyl transferase component Bud32
MHDITHLQQKTQKYRDIIIQKKFQSKKNTVAYVLHQGKPRILKWFAPGFQNNMNTEANILTKATLKLALPTLFEKDSKNHFLTLSYIPGANLCDLLNTTKTTAHEKKRLIQLLGIWFADFHNHFKTSEHNVIRGDATLRNFLFTDRIWGLDFEETRPGKPIEDIATLCTSILTTHPMATQEKYSLCTHFVKTYKQHVNWNLPNLIDEISYTILQRTTYRPDDEQKLRHIATTIKNNPQFLL